MTTLHISVAQGSPQSNNLMKNSDLVITMIQQAKEMDADLIIFPELFLCGYNITAIKNDPNHAAITLENEYLNKIKNICKEKGISAIIGACMRMQGGLTNSAIVIGKTGEIVNTYHKMHLFAGEKQVFNHGNQMVMFNCLGYKIGVGICYDGGFPEFSRILTENGADIIVYPSAFAIGDEKRRYHLYYPLRALENTAYVAVANLTGYADTLHFFGESMIIDPSGKIITMADASPGIIHTEIDKEVIKQTRERLTYLADIRPDLYDVDLNENSNKSEK